jgi:hypothetical protein
MSSSARVKTNNFLYFSATAACVVIGTATLIYMASNGTTTAPFGYADKPAEKHCWLICCERKILFRLKKKTS